ncbi:MAG: DUF3179 domain-containing protein [Myxococcales bacterium]|nr:DUF3179 domain-containing protein [Myxococcales bacterium]
MRRRAWLLSLLAVLLAVATLVTPVWVMRPFRPQAAGELAVALGLLRFAPWLMAGALALALWAVVRAWPGGWLRRTGAVLALVVVVAAGAAARVNVFEQMFAPMPAPSFVAVDEAATPGDAIVMAVRAGGAARAYPVHVMAYHHVLNDDVGDTPLVVTY